MRRIVFFQFGDYGEAYLRLRDGGPETYRDQKKSVDYVAGLANDAVVTTVAISERRHDEVLTPSLRSIGAPWTDMTAKRIAGLLDELAPDGLIVRMPHAGMIGAAGARRIPTLPCFADIFENASLRDIWRNMRLRRALAAPSIPCVANHSLNASRSVARALFYPKSRIVPWDWSRVPVAPTPKPGFRDPAAPTAFFAGMISEAKGVDDCLEAMALLRSRGVRLSMSFAGSGDLDAWQARAAQLGVADAARFLGSIPNTAVREAMRAHDIVVVPSRHNYAEGLPNTIYEGLAARSALMISDHPAFRGRLAPDENCLVFRAADPRALADTVARLLETSGLYARLSENAAQAVESLYVGMEWQALVNAFIADPKDETGWVARNSLAALGL